VRQIRTAYGLSEKLHMKFEPNITTAVLLATFNGEEHIRDQMESLTKNSTKFTLHWLDDHSVDSTRSAVRAESTRYGIQLQEWHHSDHLGLPGNFFYLIENVEADIYLFCDQDDIWQPGKIDAIVNALILDLESPVLCFSEFLYFTEGELNSPYTLSRLMGLDARALLREPRWFTCCPAFGHTIGFTRALREVFLTHKRIAREYAFVHDYWMYLLSNAVGTCRLLSNVPTTLYRRHQSNTSVVIFKSLSFWRAIQLARHQLSKQAAGFELATESLPATAKLQRMRGAARLITTLDRKHTLKSLFNLWRAGVLPPLRGNLFWTIAFRLSLLLRVAR
jgi:glycosyltransferase involved in cell wall biosynthesis